MTTNVERRQSARRALTAAYPSVMARGDEPTEALACDLVSDALHLIYAETDGSDAERLAAAEAAHARAWRNFMAELAEGSRAGASRAGASEVERCGCGKRLDAGGEHDGGYGAFCGPAQAPGAPVTVTGEGGGGELLRLLTERGLCTFLDGYTSEDGVIQADPATVAAEAAAAGLVATLGMAGWAVADPFGDEYLSDGYESPAEALLAADARLAMERARPLDSDDREDVTDAERDAGTLMDAPRECEHKWRDQGPSIGVVCRDCGTPAPADVNLGAADLAPLMVPRQDERAEPDRGPVCEQCGREIEEGFTLCDSCEMQRRYDIASEDGETVHGIPTDTADALLRMANLQRDGEGRYGGTFWDRGEALRDALILLAIAGTPAATPEPEPEALSLDTMGEAELRSLAARLLPFAPVGWSA